MRVGPSRRSDGAFTLTEVMVAMGLSVLVGGLTYAVLNSATVLYAKNTAVNSAHHQLLKTLERITRDIHASASHPQLVDANRAATNGPAAGIIVEPVSRGPYALVNMAIGNGVGKMTVATGNAPKPQVGERVICPTCLIDDQIIAVAPNPSNPLTHTDLTTARSIWTNASLGTSLYYPVFIARRSAYVVNAGELRFYPISTGSSADSFVVLARGVTTATPFALPPSPTAGVEDSVLQGTFALVDSTFSQRKHRATGATVTFAVPSRAVIAN